MRREQINKYYLKVFPLPETNNEEDIEDCVTLFECRTKGEQVLRFQGHFIIDQRMCCCPATATVDCQNPRKFSKVKLDKKREMKVRK